MINEATVDVRVLAPHVDPSSLLQNEETENLPVSDEPPAGWLSTIGWLWSGESTTGLLWSGEPTPRWI